MRTKETFDRITHAIVRKPGKNFAEGVSPAVGIPDYERALYQHRLYCEALEKCGVHVLTLKNDPLFPDGCFINDMAVITDNLAVMSNFSEHSPRQGEQQSVASALAGNHFLKFITAPGKLDAGDVADLDGHFYIGLSTHTNQEGAAQLAFFLKEFGHEATVVDISPEENTARLKTAVTYLGNDRILIREELARHYAFLAYEKVIVPKEEKGAANAFMVNGKLVLPSGYRKTMDALRLAGIPFLEVNVSEFEKMNGGLSCLSLRLPLIEKSNVVTLPQKSGARVVA